MSAFFLKKKEKKSVLVALKDERRKTCRKGRQKTNDCLGEEEKCKDHSWDSCSKCLETIAIKEQGVHTYSLKREREGERERADAKEKRERERERERNIMIVTVLETSCLLCIMFSYPRHIYNV